MYEAAASCPSTPNRHDEGELIMSEPLDHCRLCLKRLIYLRSTPAEPTTEPQAHHYVCSWCGSTWTRHPNGTLLNVSGDKYKATRSVDDA